VVVLTETVAVDMGFYRALRAVVLILAVSVLTACANNEATFAAVPADADGGSAVYIYRPHATSNFMMSPTVVIDGVETFKLGNGDYRYAYLQPGDHRIGLKPADQYATAAATEVKVEKGKSIYLRVGTLLRFEADGMNTRKFWLEIVDENNALPEIEKTGYAGAAQPPPAAAESRGNGFTIDKARDPFATDSR